MFFARQLRAELFEGGRDVFQPVHENGVRVVGDLFAAYRLGVLQADDLLALVHFLQLLRQHQRAFLTGALTAGFRHAGTSPAVASAARMCCRVPQRFRIFVGVPLFARREEDLARVIRHERSPALFAVTLGCIGLDLCRRLDDCQERQAVPRLKAVGLVDDSDAAGCSEFICQDQAAEFEIRRRMENPVRVQADQL